MKHFISRLSLTVCICSATIVGAQETTSPYSILGVGDIDSKYYGHFFGMSSATQAIRNASYVNLDNPASLSSLDSGTLNIDFNARWRSSKFNYPQNGTYSSAYSDAQFRRLSLSFVPNSRWGLSFGIKPFSTVNYLITEKIAIQDATSSNLYKTVTGSGGLYQVYIANGITLSKNFSVGVNISYIGGSIARNTVYNYNNLNIDIERNETDFLRGGQLQGGFQYYGKITPKLRQTFGVTVTAYTSLSGTITTEYLESASVISTVDKKSEGFNLPLSAAVGYALDINGAVTIAADYRYYHWENQSLNYPNGYTAPGQRLSLGFRYAQQKKYFRQMREKLSIQLGAAYEQNYISIKNNSLIDVSATAGLGYNFTRLLNMYIGVESGKKGSKKLDQITERYTQLSVGITLKEFWQKPRKYN